MVAEILEIKVPSPGESISEVEISSWLVADGDYVEKDQIIAEIDSDKATLELPAEISGTIRLKAEAGETIKIEQVVCLIEPSSTTNVVSGAKKVTKSNENKDQVVEDYKIGDIVKWCWTETHQSTYIIVNITKSGVLLKQNFGRGQILNGTVPIKEIEK